MKKTATLIALPEQFPPFELSSVFGPDEWDKFLATLRTVEVDCSPNKNDRVAALATVCIDNQIDTMGLILGVLGPFGYDRRHVAKIVRLWTGNNPDRYLWNVDGAGKYRCIQKDEVAA